jgi:hypothetical protein
MSDPDESTPVHSGEAFNHELTALLNRYRDEFDLKYEDAIALLEFHKCQLVREWVDACNEPDDE